MENIKLNNLEKLISVIEKYNIFKIYSTDDELEEWIIPIEKIIANNYKTPYFGNVFINLNDVSELQKNIIFDI